MKRNLLKLLLCSVLMAFAVESHAQLINSRKLYSLDPVGNEKVGVRMFSDYDALSAKDHFNVVLYFSVSYPWYVYNEEESDSHRPLAIEMSFPDGVEVVSRHVDPARQRDVGMVYESDFCIIYTLKCTQPLQKDLKIVAQIGWQSCDGNLCTIGDVEPSVTIRYAKDQKSPLYKEINKHLKK